MRVLWLDARAHGQRQRLADPAAVIFDVFRDGLVARLDHVGVE
jgi:hypothetical protein